MLNKIRLILYYKLKRLKQLIILILIFGSSIAFSNSTTHFKIINDSLNFSEITKNYGDTVDINKTKIRYFTRKRFIAIALVILTGPLGGHRLYLGTHPVVPVFYALTLGGGFIVLPLIDLINIIFTKDLSKFENNERVIMWLNADKDKK